MTDTATFKGGSFRTLLRRYSNWRMARDPQYKADVEKAMAEKFAAAQNKSEVGK